MTAVSLSNIHLIVRTGFLMKPKAILRGIDLEIPQGELFGLLGANGAGKTSLLQLLAGIRRPTRGKIELFGREVQRAEARRNLGFLPERPYFPDSLTGKELLHFYGSLDGLSSGDLKKRIPQVLERVGMAHAAHVMLRRYSKGMLQRIGIAQALLHDPQLLVLDEPMSGLDSLARREMRELLQSLHSQGKTLVMTTHILEDAVAVCGKVVILREGKVFREGPLAQFLDDSEEAFEVIYSGSSVEDSVAVPEGYRRVLPSSEELNRCLDRIRGQGGKIRRVNPVRPVLERWLKDD